MFILPKHSTSSNTSKKRFCEKMIKPNKRHSPKCCKTAFGLSQHHQTLLQMLGFSRAQNASCFTLRFGTFQIACGFRRKSLDDFLKGWELETVSSMESPHSPKVASLKIRACLERNPSSFIGVSILIAKKKSGRFSM